MPDNSQLLEASPVPTLDFPVIPKDAIGMRTDPLALDIDDSELVRIIDKRIEDYKLFYKEKYDLFNRRKKNETYYFGRQIEQKEKENDLKPYESRNQDNVLYEIEASIKPLAMSRLPDMIVVPGIDEEGQIQTAKDLTLAVDSEIKKRQNRRVLGLAFKHLPIYFDGVIKARWDPELGDDGDYCYEVVHPDNVVFDHTCPTNNADDMSYVAEALTLTVQEMVMRFPEKKEELYKELKKKGLMLGETPTWKDLATPIKFWEIWSTWYKKKETTVDQPAPMTMEAPPEPQVTREDEWERVEGVIWKFGTVILKKIKNPNYDWEGETKYFTYAVPGDETTKQEVNPQEMLMSMMMGMPTPSVETEQVYHNYFDMPKKPYFFLGYDQWGKQPLDETSRVEQNIRNQETLDKREKQINEKLDMRGKHVFSKDGGLKPDDIEKLDINDPNQDILIEGDVNKTHSFIAPDPVTAQEFQDIMNTRDRMYSIAGSTSIRGSLQTDVATSNQIAREADFTRADDLVEDTINAASEWMASWALQFIKLRYTQKHLRRLMGAKGEAVFIKLHRDMVADGMEVMIKSSGTDKLKAQRNAIEMAKLGPPFTNPLDFFNDMDIADPEGRAERGMIFANDPAMYIAKYLEHLPDTQAMAGALNGTMPPAGGPVPAAPAPTGGEPALPAVQDTSQVPVAPPAVPEGSPRGL